MKIQGHSTYNPDSLKTGRAKPHPLPFIVHPYYRVRQFLQGFAAQVGKGERQLARELLPVGAWPLFARMPVDAQRHSLNVLYDVQTAGFHDADLAVAALLHDAGKVKSARPLSSPPDWGGKRGGAVTLGLWQRGPLVLLEWLAPALLPRWASADERAGWRHLLYLHLHHPRLGAAAARAGGCAETACWLIEHHQDIQVPATGRRLELLRVLQWADGRN